MPFRHSHRRHVIISAGDVCVKIHGVRGPWSGDETGWEGVERERAKTSWYEHSESEKIRTWRRRAAVLEEPLAEDLLEAGEVEVLHGEVDSEGHGRLEAVWPVMVIGSTSAP